MNRHFLQSFRGHSQIRQALVAGAFAIGISITGESRAAAAPPFIDEDGYYWSETQKPGESPVIQDRADLIFYTDGLWRWTLTVDGESLMKIAESDFYKPETNPRQAELVEMLHQARARTDEVENQLSAKILAEFKPSDQATTDKLNALLAKFKRGEKGEKLETELGAFIAPETAKKLVADRNQQRRAIFDQLERSNHAMRFDLALRNSPEVATTTVSERAMFVQATPGSRPLVTDSGEDGFCEALGFPFSLIRAEDGVFYAVLTNAPQPGSLGSKLKLLQGDAITAVNDVPVKSPESLEQLGRYQVILTIVKQADGIPKRARVR